MSCADCGARGDTYQLDTYGPDLEGSSQPGLYTTLEEGYQVPAQSGAGGSSSSTALILLGGIVAGVAVAAIATRRRY